MTSSALSRENCAVLMGTLRSQLPLLPQVVDVRLQGHSLGTPAELMASLPPANDVAHLGRPVDPSASQPRDPPPRRSASWLSKRFSTLKLSVAPKLASLPDEVREAVQALLDGDAPTSVRRPVNVDLVMQDGAVRSLVFDVLPIRQTRWFAIASILIGAAAVFGSYASYPLLFGAMACFSGLGWMARDASSTFGQASRRFVVTMTAMCIPAGVGIGAAALAFAVNQRELRRLRDPAHVARLRS